MKPVLYDEWDMPPEKDPAFVGDVSKNVTVILKDERILEGCHYTSTGDQWWYRGKEIIRTQILKWHYDEEDKI